MYCTVHIYSTYIYNERSSSTKPERWFQHPTKERVSPKKIVRSKIWQTGMSLGALSLCIEIRFFVVNLLWDINNVGYKSPALGRETVKKVGIYII